MTKETAQEFDRYSVTNAAILQGAAASHNCQCEPYRDWFTYARWQAQGFQVRKGEHGTKIATYAPITRKNDDGETVTVGKRPWTSTVFCRCQVGEKGEPATEPVAVPACKLCRAPAPGPRHGHPHDYSGSVEDMLAGKPCFSCNKPHAAYGTEPAPYTIAAVASQIAKVQREHKEPWPGVALDKATLDAQADSVWELQHPSYDPFAEPEPEPVAEPEPAPARRGVNISHDYPMPRNRDIRCQQGHVSKAICESPIFCRQCHTAAVVWVAPKAVKAWAPGRIGVGA